MPKNNQGFIAISLIYSFFVLFIILILGILSNYSKNRILLTNITNEIKADLNKSLTINENSYSLELLGDLTINLNLNEVFVDPGFQVINNLNEIINTYTQLDLEVEISNINLDQIGEYEIIYNLKNATTTIDSKTRTIIIS